MKNNTILTVILVIVVALAGFYAGMQYQKMQQPKIGQFAQGGTSPMTGQFARHFGNSNGNSGAVIGQIVSEDSKSITVKLPDGSSKIVLLSSSTKINKQVAGSQSDLKSGENVAVIGSTNSDGSVTAQAIQLNPQMRFGRKPSPTQ